eukprot:TRINITY_DN6402_c0_g2_i1.p1 TRINITY_DN6402_c0_g2~~TRINITY_DN6402_c0_g2_i1.p1  ORF type:complete len:1315 (-),score=241.75 TRINITY_DN6402_c0_g2_i1:125-4069(-)
MSSDSVEQSGTDSVSSPPIRIPNPTVDSSPDTSESTSPRDDEGPRVRIDTHVDDSIIDYRSARDGGVNVRRRTFSVGHGNEALAAIYLQEEADQALPSTSPRVSPTTSTAPLPLSATSHSPSSTTWATEATAVTSSKKKLRGRGTKSSAPMSPKAFRHLGGRMGSVIFDRKKTVKKGGSAGSEEVPSGGGNIRIQARPLSAPLVNRPPDTTNPRLGNPSTRRTLSTDWRFGLKRKPITIDTTSGPSVNAWSAVNIAPTRKVVVSKVRRSVLEQIFASYGQVDLHVNESRLVRLQAIARGWLARRELKRLKKMAKQRSNIAKELLSTERSYISQLGTLVAYQVQLKKADETLIKAKAVTVLFGNVQEVYNTNRAFLVALEKCLKNWVWNKPISVVFHKHLFPKLTVYRDYCLNYGKALLTLTEHMDRSSALEKHLKRVQMDMPIKLDLQALLIVPIQRLLRYKLLLTELQKHTEMEHGDYKPIKRSVKLIQVMADHSNKMISARDNLVRLKTIQKSVSGLPPIVDPSREYVRDGILVKQCRKDTQKRHFFLFSDCFFYASKSSTDSMKNSLRGGSSSLGAEGGTTGLNLRFHRLMPLTPESKIIDCVRMGPLKFPFKILTSKKSFVISAKTGKEKVSWVESFMTVIQNLGRQRREQELFQKITSASTSNPPPPQPITADRAESPLSLSTSLDKHAISARFADENLSTSLSASSNKGSVLRSSFPQPNVRGGPSQLGSSPLSISKPQHQSVRVSINVSHSPENSNLSSSLPHALPESGDQDIEAQQAREAKESEVEIAPVWVMDKLSRNCMICKTGFTVIRRRHHCRKCGTLCCQACSSNTYQLPNIGKKCRVCDVCYEELTGIELSKKHGSRSSMKLAAATGQILPEDVLCLVFSFLGLFSLHNVLLVCHHWSELGSVDYLWKRLYCVSFRKSCEWVAVQSRSNWKEMFRVKLSRERALMRCAPTMVMDLRRDGKAIVVDGHQIAESQRPSSVTGSAAVALIDHKRVVTAHPDTGLHIWNTKSGERLDTLNLPESFVGGFGRSDPTSDATRSIHWNAHGAQLLTGHDDGVVRVWDINRRNCIYQLVVDDDDRSGAALNGPAPDLLVKASIGCSSLWTSSGGDSVLRGAFGAGAAAFPSPGASRVVSMANALDFRMSTSPKAGRAKSDRAVLALASCDSLVYVASADGVVRVWDLYTGTCVRKFSGHSDAATCLANNGRDFLVSGSRDTTARLWDVRTGRGILYLEAGAEVCSLDLYGDRLMTGCRDGVVRTWTALTQSVQGAGTTTATGTVGAVKGVTRRRAGRCMVKGDRKSVV